MICLLSAMTISVSAQNSASKSSVIKQIYPVADQQLESGKYRQAIKNFLELLELDEMNANINYKVGVCYLNMNGEKPKAVPYLEKAASNSSNKYKNSYKEKKAPEVSLLRLAEAYHLASQFDNAIAAYKKYKGMVKGDKELVRELERKMVMCENGKKISQQPISATSENFGKVINTIYDEYAPVIDASETTLIFTSRRPTSTGGLLAEDDKYYEDIFVSNKKDGEWQNPVSIGQNVNTEGHEATISLSADGQSLFIYRDDFGDGNIYVSHLENGTWMEPNILGDNINSGFRETHASITADGQLLYFTSDRAGNSGMDIYYSKLLPNGEWGLPTPLSPKINSPYDEEAPFIHPDGKTLFFSSKGHSSMGGYDIFFSIRGDDGKWSKPINMGIPVNTSDDEYFFNTSPDGKRAYYSSSNQTGFGGKDIFLVNMNLEAEIPLTVYKGRIAKGKNGKLPENARVVVKDNETGDLFGMYTPRADNGSFVLILHPGNNYNIAYEADGYLYKSEKLYVPENSAYFEINRVIELTEMKFKKN